MTIELLYFEGCPSWERAWTELGKAIVETGTDATVRLRDIAVLSEDELVGFAGSPTVRIDGRDLEGYDGPALIACRRYPDNAGLGWPSGGVLRERLEAVRAAS